MNLVDCSNLGRDNMFSPLFTLLVLCFYFKIKSSSMFFSRKIHEIMTVLANGKLFLAISVACNRISTARGPRQIPVAFTAHSEPQNTIRSAGS